MGFFTKTAMDALMKTTHPEINRRQCWNLHPHRKPCTTCKDICPYGEEIFSRHEVHIEKYCKVIRIEAATLVDMVQHGILNAASEYEAALCNTIAAKRAAAPELTCHVESSLANAIGSLNEQLLEETIGLKTALETVSDDAEPETLLHYYHDEVEKRTNDVRKTVDKLEVLTASKYWPYPTFCELLFSV